MVFEELPPCMREDNEYGMGCRETTWKKYYCDCGDVGIGGGYTSEIHDQAVCKTSTCQ